MKRGGVEIYPEFFHEDNSDLMIRGGTFYAVWDESIKMWTEDIKAIMRRVDDDLWKRYEEVKAQNPGIHYDVKDMKTNGSGSWATFKRFIKECPDDFTPLNSKIVFNNTVKERSLYSSKTLPYDLQKGSIDSYEELMSTLYNQEERDKIEWCIGAILANESCDIQKFLVLYGDAGAGKSTILNIIQRIFEGYYTTFEAKSLVGANSSFGMEAFRTNPLVGIQHDGDLSKIEDNTRLNSLVSHEEMLINVKHQSAYSMKTNCFLMLASNKPVKITDAKSGLLRRLIDCKPSGRKLSPTRYDIVVNRVQTETGSIAFHCLEKYRAMGKHYYNSYRPTDMQEETDYFYNFIVEEAYDVFRHSRYVTLKQAYDIYKTYCDDTNMKFITNRASFKTELKNYFDEYHERLMIDGERCRNVYLGFRERLFKQEDLEFIRPEVTLVLDKKTSILDDMLKDCPAQGCTSSEAPKQKWANVDTTLRDIDTSEVHYVKPPIDHIVIDFDLKDENGIKSPEKNLEAASKWPPTYAEFSKSGGGLHLHYIYKGDVDRLSNFHSDGIEIKVFRGGSSLRRKLSLCNNIPVADIYGGLPIKESKTMLNTEVVKNEQAIRTLIYKNLNKDYHPGTKPSIDFIHKILEESYASGVQYDVTDMRNMVLEFAMQSSNQADYCIKLVKVMRFRSEEQTRHNIEHPDDKPIAFYDVEVFPNLFIVVYKEIDKPCQRLINPTPQEVGKVLDNYRLIGFNCRRYDNHIMYARYIGKSIEELYRVSQQIVNNNGGMFREAYNLSYTDVYDYASAMNKNSLKKWEIILGIHHVELGLPWDQPVDESKWPLVAEYCDNDVIATEAVHKHLKGDFVARQILAKMSGLTINDTTNAHSTKIIFGDEKNPQSEFNYVPLSEMFPGYKYEFGKSTYRDETPGEGGYVYSKPGMYGNVALLDVASMHPSSIEAMNMFGPYTDRFSDIKGARMAIKHGDIDHARTMLDGMLEEFLTDETFLNDEVQVDGLCNALKTVINSVYGLTSASFENPFKDPRNIDNIVAKRGALFMIDLKHAVLEEGYDVAHIKTDSIKIPDADDHIVQFVMEFGKKYGYTFEHEATYDRMCLVNKAVYIAKYKGGKKDGKWTATGTQFAQPYVHKKLFTKEPIVLDDLCETKSVKSSMYLNMNENSEEDNLVFVGKVGSFCPIKPGFGGGELLRTQDDKLAAVTGTKGYRWMEEEVVRKNDLLSIIDTSYYDKLVDEAKESIDKLGDYDWFVADNGYYDNVNNVWLPF